MSLREQLIRHEGLRLKPYTDTVGKLTIGVGRNLTDRGISKAEAMHLLDNDILEAQTAVVKALPWTVEIDRPRLEILMNMAFNLGIGGLLKFERFLAAVQEGSYELAAVEMLNSKWAKQVGQRADELASMMRTGIDPFPKSSGGEQTG